MLKHACQGGWHRVWLATSANLAHGAGAEDVMTSSPKLGVKSLTTSGTQGSGLSGTPWLPLLRTDACRAPNCLTVSNILLKAHLNQQISFAVANTAADNGSLATLCPSQARGLDAPWI